MQARSVVNSVLVCLAITTECTMWRTPSAADGAAAAVSTSTTLLSQTLAGMRTGDVLVKTAKGATLVQLDPTKLYVVKYDAAKIDVKQVGPAPPPRQPGCKDGAPVALKPISTTELSKFQSATAGSLLIAADNGFYLASSPTSSASIDLTSQKPEVRQTGPAPPPKPPGGC